MPSQSRRQYVTVEVKPESTKARASTRTSPSPGSPGKQVRFAKETITKAEPRQPTITEAWSFYHFESHATQCAECYNPLNVYSQRRQFCATGHSLAQDVAEHVYRQDGVVYSRQKDNHKLVQVEMPHDYSQTAQLLRAMQSALRTTKRTVPTLSYDRHYPIAARRISDDEYAVYDGRGRREVVIEPASSHDRRSSRYATQQKSEWRKGREDDSELTTPASRERRSSLYYDDLKRERREAYQVEIRAPEGAERRERRREHRERPKSAFWL